ncbi:hypothetical protein ANCCAN_23152 [Ancylostoma caninum]|uniref:SCP domain-containing protein n=1 Tax=Ancylostoma caninum TaxID=29170 RepID=A0A368FJQ9_ANCCA|nr:hypothetical protein ANCCAN_23152 [Ancylostoma caninum]
MEKPACIFQGYSCPLENSAKFFAFMRDHPNWYQAREFRFEVSRHSGYGQLIQKAVEEWSAELEKLTGPQTIGCNHGRMSNGKTAVVCLVVPKI